MDGKFYKCDDHQHPRVTSILQVIAKEALLQWYAKTERELVMEVATQLYIDAPSSPKMSSLVYSEMLHKRLGPTKAAQRKLLQASDIGSQAHAWIEATLRKQLGQITEIPVISDEAMWAVMAWEDWAKTVDLKPIWIESRIVSERHDYAGTLDLVAELNLRDTYRDYGRTMAVLDWKTGKAIYPEARLQNAAYSYAFKEMGHAEKVLPGLILRLPKVTTDPKFEPLVVHEDEMPELFHTFIQARALWIWQYREEEKRKKAWDEKKKAETRETVEAVSA